jgi:choline dehydrogenase-like flavoprotein
MAGLRARGLHPYRLHAALAGLPGCTACLGRKCPRPCKMDGRSAGVEPALATGRAVLLDRAEVLRIEMEGARATAVTLRQQDGATRRIAADRVILAAGALSSPRLLAASAGPDWPAGIGNRHDLVGRHLMFHLNEMIAVWTGTPAEEGPSKAVGFRDLCHAGGERLGMVQAMGLNARYGEILHVLRNRAAALPLGRSRLVQEGLRLPALLAERWLGSAAILVGLLEDLPDPENRVIHDPARPGRIVLAYRVTDELRRRRRLFRRLIARAFRGRRHLFLSDRPEPNLGHPCGTTRMGRTPAEGVTDALGRVHGTANLWIADAGLFPTSMGVNPSLTIAALALRQADSILKGRG